MTFGISIHNPNTNDLVLNETYPIPEFIGKVTLSPNPVINARQGTAPYTQRRHAIASMPNQGGRDAMIFWAIPDTGGADVWFCPWRTHVYANDSGQTPGMDILLGNGASMPPLPVGYMFALGGATYSNEQFGIRVWDANGVLIFDSGSKQMYVTNVIVGVDMTIDAPHSQAVSLPGSPAFLIPNTYYIQDQQTPADFQGVESSETYVEWRGSIRRNGSNIDSFMPEMAHFYSYGGTATNDYSAANYFGNNTGLVIPVIDTSLYD